jgi:hypothetical protein
MATSNSTAIGVEIQLLREKITIYNIYSPGRPKAAIDFIHTLLPKPNSILIGDFNAHDEWWNGATYEYGGKGDAGTSGMVVTGRIREQ